MNLTTLLFEPYIITIFIALIITGIVYFIIKNDKNDEENNKNISSTLLYTFIISYILLVLIIFLLKYMNSNKYFQKGGETITSDHLTLVADDIVVDII